MLSRWSWSWKNTKKLQIVKCGRVTHVFNPPAEKSKASTWTPEIRVTNSVCVWDIVIISPSVPELWCWTMARVMKCLSSTLMSQWSWPLHLGYKMSPLHPFYPSRNLLSQLVYEFLRYGQEMCFVRSKWKSLPTISLGLSPSGCLKKLPQGVLSSWEWDGRLSPWQSSAWQHKEVFKKEKKITDTNCAIQLLLGKKRDIFYSCLWR